MVAASSSIRQVLTVSNHAVRRRGPLRATSRRVMSTAALSSVEDRAPIDLHIFDIFDAPSRLGESSKMLVQCAARRVERAVALPADRSAPARPAVAPLPAPVLYDGPARPSSHRPQAARIRRMHSQAQPSVDSVCTLPPPEVFDGPSRLRPYLRDGESSDIVSILVLATVEHVLNVI